MAARVLAYDLGSPSYGISKLDKWKNFTKIVQQSLSLQLVYGKLVFLDAATKNGTIFSSK